MLPERRNLRATSYAFWAIILLLCAIFGARAENVVLYLKSGDKISGFVVSEYTNRLILSNSWARELTVPLKEIERREILAAAGTNRLAGTNVLAKAKPPLKPGAEPPPLFKHWKGQAEVGLDLSEATVDQQTYHGHFTLSYEHPYVWDTNMFFRNNVDYTVQYGKSEQTVSNKNITLKSSDLMGGSDKSTFDLTRHWYVYNLAGAGYDRIRDIDLQAEAGPGLGYHLLTQTNLTMNLESGANYQIQYRSDNTEIRDFFGRLAEDFNWKLTPRTSFTEKVEFFPRVNFSEYRVRLEATLTYTLWRYVYLNLSVHDAYDTEPADDTAANELLVHSALGMKF